MRAASHNPGGYRQCRVCNEDISLARTRRSSELNIRPQTWSPRMKERSMLDRTQSPTTIAKDLPNSLEAVNDYFYEQGFTDGLPIIPPTPERVERMLAGMHWREPDSIVGVVPPAMGVATLRSIATDAVMARS